MLFPKGRYATGHAPAAASENFTLVAASGELRNEALEDLASFIRGRYPADELTMKLGVSVDSITSYKSGSGGLNCITGSLQNVTTSCL